MYQVKLSYIKKTITRNLNYNLTNPNNEDVKLYMIEVGELFQKKKKKIYLSGEIVISQILILGVAKLDTTREPDTTQYEINKLQVEI